MRCANVGGGILHVPIRSANAVLPSGGTQGSVPCYRLIVSLVLLSLGLAAAGAMLQTRVLDHDWLVEPIADHAKMVVRAPNEIALENGLIRRTFRLAPNAACISLDNLMTGEAMLRAVKPEAELEIDGKPYNVGGLDGQPDLAFLRPEWLGKMTADPNAFRYQKYDYGVVQAPIRWKRVRHAGQTVWPPKGVSLTFEFTHQSLPGITVDVRYEMYDGIPCMLKQLIVKNDSDHAIRLNSFKSEILGVVEAESEVDSFSNWNLPNIDAYSDFSFAGMTATGANKVIRWVTDPAYESQVSYNLETPCVLESSPPIGPNFLLASGSVFRSHRTYELVHDSSDRERKSLATRILFRTFAPWSTENPIMLHLTTTDPVKARLAMDQAAECGFEMVIFSFGSGLDAEDVSDDNIAKYKAFADYAHGKGLQIGCYSLLASRHIDDENDAINPKTGKPGGLIFGYSPCLLSRWGIQYFKNVKTFLEKTGFDLLEHDGSYPGDPCASTTHPGHEGLLDSQWKQWQVIADFYAWCREKGIFLNVPDWYVLAGSNKTGMGYRETNWSLPRDLQPIHARQNMYDGTWFKAPSMGWMFVPLTEYHGGGAAATIEPLKDHLQVYGLHLASAFGFGVQACYRGPRLYDSPQTKDLVIKWVTWFKKHREILESDVIHVRRADGRDLDVALHVNSRIAEHALAVVYNPTDHAITKELILPLYYSGLTGQVVVWDDTGNGHNERLDRSYRLKLKVSVPAMGVASYVIKRGT